MQGLSEMNPCKKPKRTNLLDMQREFQRTVRKKRLELIECPTWCPRFKEHDRCTPSNCIEIERRLAKMDRATLRAYRLAIGDKETLDREEKRKHRKGIPYRDKIILKKGLKIGRGQPDEWGLRDDALYQDIAGDKTVWALPDANDEVTHRVTIYGIRHKEILEKNGNRKVVGSVKKKLATVEVCVKDWDKLHRKNHSYLYCEFCLYRKEIPCHYASEEARFCPKCGRKLAIRICKACLSELKAKRKAWEWYEKDLLPSIGKNYVYLPFSRYEETVENLTVGNKRSIGKIWRG